jgi:hypothetical protein
MSEVPPPPPPWPSPPPLPPPPPPPDYPTAPPPPSSGGIAMAEGVTWEHGVGVLSIQGNEVIDHIRLTKTNGVFHRESVVIGDREERYSISSLKALYRSRGRNGYGVTLNDGGEIGRAIDGFPSAKTRDSFIAALVERNPALVESPEEWHSPVPTGPLVAGAAWQPMASGESEAEKYYRRKNRAARKRKIGRAAATTACCGIPCLLTATLLIGMVVALASLLFWL